ncbi:MAG: 50S ribosome-binding GTPase [Planctomycetota bacterium]|nr:50S ribosome-binding GTPase [Planctomycetota bacterium]
MTQITAEAPGAIAVLRLWGPDAVTVANRLFRPKLGTRGLIQSQPGELRLGWFGMDEVVALIITDSNLSTPPEVEIQGHGSPLLVQSILNLLQEEGIHLADHGQYLKHQGVGWLERLALDHFQRTNAPKAAQVIWNQVDGSLRNALVEIRDLILAHDTHAAISRIDSLLLTAPWGSRLSRGFKVALAGAPNAGKSTLVNALAGYERVLVSPVPGTTRDLVDVALTIDGWPFVVTDMAGLRDLAADPLEAAGIALARGQQSQADLVIRLFEPDAADGEIEIHASHHLTVMTKLDLISPQEASNLPSGILGISAKTGMGLDELMARMITALIPEHQTIHGLVKPVVFDTEIEACLNQARQWSNQESAVAASWRIDELLSKP